MSRISDRELDRRLHDAIMHLDETPRLAAAVKEARARVFPLHCTACGEIPHEGLRCRRPSERKSRTLGLKMPEGWNGGTPDRGAE